MMYLGRPSGVAPIYLLRRDFSKTKDPQVLAQADAGIDKFAWSPDGTVGVAITSGRAVALRPGQEARRLADNINAVTFGWDSDTVYAVRITRDGADDRAQILRIDFVSGAVKTLATVRYPHPLTAPEASLREAQFIDDGGLVRIYAVADGNLTLWILGAPDVYRIDAANGDVRNSSGQPTLWSPDGAYRVTLHEADSTTALRLRDRSNEVVAAVSVTGLVSHVRWAGTSNEIVFTLGVLSAGGGVRQDLFVWDLENRNDPLPLTSNGVSFGAEWRGDHVELGAVMQEIVYPIGVELDETAHVMRIRWDDGHLGEWGWLTLRQACPCALCAGEGNQPGVVTLGTIFTPQQTTMERVKWIGRYAAGTDLGRRA